MQKTKFLIWSLTAALSGFLFGLDTAVISGAEQTIQRLWQLSDTLHGLAIAIALYGTVIGAFVGGLCADKWGRKRVLLGIGIFYFISSLGSALSLEVYTFMTFRLIGGLCIGITSVVTPLYISEIAPPQKRGLLVALFQFNIVFGILIAYLSNYLFQHVGENSWRWMLGIVGIPSLLYTMLTFFISESPHWLFHIRKDPLKAKQVLHTIDSTHAEKAFAALEEVAQKQHLTKQERFFSKKYLSTILLVFLMAFFNQVSGINAVIYYAPRIFEMAGLGTSTALLSSVGIGFTNLAFTLLGLSLIDKYGRKTLMYIGSIGYIISLFFIAYAFYANQFRGISLMVFGFIASHAIGQGTVIWVYISEVFPSAVRAKGSSMGSFTHWILAALITNIFPVFSSHFGASNIFLFFGIMMVLQLLYVALMMKETKGTTLS